MAHPHPSRCCRWAVAQLGWVAGPLLLVLFYLVTRRASIMLAELYCVDGLEHARYHHAGAQRQGKHGGWVGMDGSVQGQLQLEHPRMHPRLEGRQACGAQQHAGTN